VFKTSSIEFFTIFAEFLRFFYTILRSGTEVHPSDALLGCRVPSPPMRRQIWVNFGPPIRAKNGRNRDPTLTGIFRGPVIAGKRAGMSGTFAFHLLFSLCCRLTRSPIVVWVPDENLLSVESSQLTEKPDQVLRSLEAFVPEEWGLPPLDNVVVSQQSGKEE
jgi:hypothetical protein